MAIRLGDAEILLRHKAAQVQAVGDFLEFIEGVVSESRESSVSHVDNWFSYAFRKFESGSSEILDWLAGPLLDMQLSEERFCRAGQGCTIYRHFMIPHPKFMRNSTYRDLYRELIISVLHLQVVTSVVVFVHFSKPDVVPGDFSERFLQTTVLPEQGLGCTACQFHAGEYNRLEILSGQSLIDAAAKITSVLARTAASHRLYYSDDTFVSKRLNSGAWDRLRRFFWDLSDPEFRCFHCKEAIPGNGEDMDLDHLMPLKVGGVNTLLNLRPAHAKCNRRRREDPYWRGQAFIPAGGGLNGLVLHRFSDEFRPLWLGNIVRPDGRSGPFRRARDYMI